MARRNNRILRNVLDLPWTDNPREAHRVYMQIYRSPDPIAKVEEMLRAKKTRLAIGAILPLFLNAAAFMLLGAAYVAIL